jgi:hypothetical protein
MWKSPRPRWQLARGEQADGVDRAVDPEIVAVDDEEAVILDQRQRLDEPAAGFEEKGALVGDRDVDVLHLVREMRLQRVGKIMDVDHRALDPGGAKPIEDMIEQRLAGDFDERLGARRGERPHALAEPGGHHHRGADRRLGGVRIRAEREGLAIAAHSGIVSQAAARAAAGTLASNQRATGASAGWARSRSI